MPRFVDLLVEIGELTARDAAMGAAAPLAAEPQAAEAQRTIATTRATSVADTH